MSVCVLLVSVQMIMPPLMVKDVLQITFLVAVRW